MRMVGMMAMLLACSGDASDPSPPPVTTTPSTSTTTTGTATIGPGATTATGCLNPNPVYASCTADTRSEIVGLEPIVGSIEFDDCGRPEWSEWLDEDGIISRSDRWLWFADGRQAGIERDGVYEPYDGVVDDVTTFFYDAQSRSTGFEIDAGPSFGSCVTTLYYDFGHVLWDREVSDCNGFLWTVTYTTDASLPIDRSWISSKIDHGSDGAIEVLNTWTWDAALNQTAFISETTSDGARDIELTQWNAVGRESWTRIDIGGDGVVEYEDVLTYDVDGRQTLLESIQITQGIPTVILSMAWEWHCPGGGTPAPVGGPPGLEQLERLGFDLSGRMPGR